MRKRIVLRLVTIGLPFAIDLQQVFARPAFEGVFGQLTGQANSRPHLLHVSLTAFTPGQMAFKALSLLCGQRAFQIIGDEFD
jgi:hypothetical protein